MTRTSKKTKKVKLARPGDPLVLANGKKIFPEKVVDDEDLEPAGMELAEYRPSEQRSAKDLPAPATTMSGISVVLVYSILGLSPREIAEAIGATVEAVEKAKDHPAYADTFKLLVNEIINADSEVLQSRIAAYGHGALTSLANVALHGKQEGNIMRASTTLLELGGHTKKQKLNMEDGDLRIVVTDGDNKVDISIGNVGGL